MFLQVSLGLMEVKTYQVFKVLNSLNLPFCLYRVNKVFLQTSLGLTVFKT